MKLVNIGESSSVLNRFVVEMRDVNIQKDGLRFRRNIERIGEIMAYEISHNFTYSPKRVVTPLGPSVMSQPDFVPVIGTIFRAGLPFQRGGSIILFRRIMRLCRLTGSIKTG
jgi:uracil phosphoribosyltransferase